MITSAVSRLEAAGLMNEMNERLTEDEPLAASYRAAHEAYLQSRAEIGRRTRPCTAPVASIANRTGSLPESLCVQMSPSRRRLTARPLASGTSRRFAGSRVRVHGPTVRFGDSAAAASKAASTQAADAASFQSPRPRLNRLTPSSSSENVCAGKLPTSYSQLTTQK